MSFCFVSWIYTNKSNLYYWSFILYLKRMFSLIDFPSYIYAWPFPEKLNQTNVKRGNPFHNRLIYVSIDWARHVTRLLRLVTIVFAYIWTYIQVLGVSLRRKNHLDLCAFIQISRIKLNIYELVNFNIYIYRNIYIYVFI